MAVRHLQGWTGEYLCLICWNQKQVSSSFCTTYMTVVRSVDFFFFFFTVIWDLLTSKPEQLEHRELLRRRFFSDSACCLKSCRVMLVLSMRASPCSSAQSFRRLDPVCSIQWKNPTPRRSSTQLISPKRGLTAHTVHMSCFRASQKCFILNYLICK